MPFLNWGDSPVVLQAVQKTDRETQLILGLSEILVRELAQELTEIYAASGISYGKELRWVLPQSWVVFWKTRIDGARLLLAHPQKDEWVGTMALAPDWSSRWVESLQNLRPGQSVVLSQMGGVHSVSNFDLVVRLDPSL